MVILIKRKLQNRKCLNGCLLLGIVLFIAIAACTPMFKKGSLNKLIQSKFVDYIEENNEYPAVIARNTSLQVKGGFDFGEVTGKIEGYGKKWKEYLQIPERETEVHIWLEGSATKRQYKEDTQWGNIACIPQMEEHIKICSGAFYEEEKVLNQEKGTEQGKVYPCIITEKLMDDWGMVEGEQIEFSEYTDENGNALTVQVVGIFDEINNTDIFWHVEADEFEKEFFVSESSMKDIGSRFSFNEIYYDMYMLLDYSKIHSGNIMDIEYYLKQFYEKDKKFI